MRRAIAWIICLVLAVVLCTACGGENPKGNQPADYSGTYTDKQGTSDIYSALELRRNEDEAYDVTLSIYRVTELTGTASETEAGGLHFDCNVPDIHVAGEIAVDGGTAKVTITESDFAYIQAGTEYIFPDGE